MAIWPPQRAGLMWQWVVHCHRCRNVTEPHAGIKKKESNFLCLESAGFFLPPPGAQVFDDTWAKSFAKNECWFVFSLVAGGSEIHPESSFVALVFTLQVFCILFFSYLYIHNFLPQIHFVMPPLKPFQILAIDLAVWFCATLRWFSWTDVTVITGEALLSRFVCCCWGCWWTWRRSVVEKDPNKIAVTQILAMLRLILLPLLIVVTSWLWKGPYLRHIVIFFMCACVQYLQKASVNNFFAFLFLFFSEITAFCTVLIVPSVEITGFEAQNEFVRLLRFYWC